MDNITQEIRRVQAALRGGHVSHRELARLAGISDTTLIGCKEPSWNPTANTLRALSLALDKLDFFPVLTSREDSENVAA